MSVLATFHPDRTAEVVQSIVNDDLTGYFLELLEAASEAMIDVVTKDLETFEATGHASLTVLSLIKRARCLADADRIEMKFAA